MGLQIFIFYDIRLNMDPNNQNRTFFQTMHRILNPKSVAVVGASSRENSLGQWIMQSLISGGFPGAVYPVNPRGGEILGHKVLQEIESLPDPVDLGILAIPGQGILDAVTRLSRKGLAGVIVTAGGFAEMGQQGQKLQDDLTEIGNRSGLRLVGPNTIGIINSRSRLNASFSPDLRSTVPGGIGVISQSGSVCETLFFRCQERGFGLSTMISSGNEADLDLCDYLEYLFEDPDTSILSLYVEQIRRPRRFIELIRHRSAEKPVVMFRTGRTAQGISAASSHTGAMAGSNAVMSGLCRQLGIIDAGSYQEFIDMTVALAAGRYPTGDRLAVVTGPGAPGVASCDCAVEEGLTMASLNPASVEMLKDILPSIASCRNPVDLTGSAATNPELVSEALKIILADRFVDGVILIFGALSTAQGIEAVIRRITEQPKPVLAVTVASLTQNNETRKIVDELGRHRIPSFFTPEQAVRAFKLLANRRRHRGAVKSEASMKDKEKTQ